MPNDRLNSFIKDAFGSFEGFQEQFLNETMLLFGSGIMCIIIICVYFIYRVIPRYTWMKPLVTADFDVLLPVLIVISYIYHVLLH